MNKLELIGRLTKDPDVRYSAQGDKSLAIARYTLAVNRRIKVEGQPDADFIRCVALGKNGEFVEKYLHKGMKIAVIGEWRTGSFTDKEGKTVYTNECYVQEHEFVESKSLSNNDEDTARTTTPTTPAGSGFMNIPDNVDDTGLPFNF